MWIPRTIVAIRCQVRECEFNFQIASRTNYLKSELLNPKKLKSNTYANFSNLDHHHNMKSNSERDKNVGDNFGIGICTCK